MGCLGNGRAVGAQDADYFKQLEMERIKLYGTECEYYSLNRGANVDPLYGEPDNDPLYGGSSPLGTPQTHDLSWDFCPDVAGGEEPLIVPCAFEYTEYDNRNYMVRPEGGVVEYDAIMTISVLQWECLLSETEIACLTGRVPKKGDVVFCFEEWWDVVKPGRSGNVLGTPVYTGYKFDLKKRSQFTPDRKVEL